MTLDNLNPVSHCHTLEEAWSTVNSLRLAWGQVRLTSPKLSGGFVFMDGAILSVFIEGSNQRGPEAWQRLASARNADLKYEQLSRQQALDHFDTEQTVQLDTGNFAATVDLPPFASQQGLKAPASLAAAPPNSSSSAQVIEFIESLHPETSALSDEQIAALAAQQLMADPEGFASKNASLAHEALIITDEQLSMLGKALAARGIQQQKEEFSKLNTELQMQHDGFFKEFTEPPAPGQPETVLQPEAAAQALGRIGFTSDFRTSGPSSELDLDEAVRNMPGNRPDAEVAAVAASARVQKQYGKILAPTLVIVLSVALYTVPAMVRHATGAVVRPEVVQDQTHLIVSSELHSYSPRERQVFILPAGSSGPIGGNVSQGASNTTPVADTSADNNDRLKQAAKLKLAGADDKASAMLEEALDASPQAADIRIDLIKMYKMQKKLKRARELAVLGFRTGGCTPKQREELWKLFMECREPVPPDAHP